MAQLGQCLAPDHRCYQEAVAFQRAPHLNQGARQIVHRLQRKQRDGEIKPAVGGREALEVANRRQETAGPQARLGWGDPDDAIDLAGRRESDGAMRAGRAKVRRKREPPFDQRQPVAEVFSRPREQEVSWSVPPGLRPDAIEAPIDQISVEYLRRRRMQHGRLLCARTPLAQSCGSG